MVVVSPSILSSDFANLAYDCNKVLDAGADMLHVDVMDGHFVPNLTLGAPILKALRNRLRDVHDKTPFYDVHLMVSEPERWVDDFAAAGASLFTFHIEATEDPVSLITAIKAAGMKAGISIKPNTPVSATVVNGVDLLGLVDLALVMTVEPGFGGQSFMPEQLTKVRAIRAAHPALSIQVDGGISAANVAMCHEAGVDNFVAGTGVFKAPDWAKAIAEMKANCEK